MTRVVDLTAHLVPLYLRAVGANRAFVTAEGARERIRDAALRPKPHGPPVRMRDDVRIAPGRRHGWPVYRLTPRDGAPTGSLVYAHGGAWVNEVVSQHWRLAAQLAVDAATTVDLVIYPLIPFGTAGDVVATFDAIVRENLAEIGPTVLAGDSAGGQIALSAALELRDAGIRLPRTVLISPALDLTWSNPRIPDVQPSDPWLGVPGGRVFAEEWRGELELLDPAVSPLAGELRGLGPLTLLSGRRDILNPDAVLLNERAAAAGVEVDFHDVEGQLHVYPLLPTATGRHARAAIVGAVRAATRA